MDYHTSPIAVTYQSLASGAPRRVAQMIEAGRMEKAIELQALASHWSKAARREMGLES